MLNKKVISIISMLAVTGAFSIPALAEAPEADLTAMTAASFCVTVNEDGTVTVYDEDGNPVENTDKLVKFDEEEPADGEKFMTYTCSAAGNLEAAVDGQDQTSFTYSVKTDGEAALELNPDDFEKDENGNLIYKGENGNEIILAVKEAVEQ